MLLADGSSFVLSEDAGGLPVAIVLAATPPSTSERLLVLHVARPESTERLGRFSLLDDGSVADALADGGDLAIVADAGHRVIAVGSPTDLDALIGRLPDAVVPVRRSTSTPLLIVPDVIDAELRSRLLVHADEIGWSPSPMLRQAGGSEARLGVDDAKARFDVNVESTATTSELDSVLQRRLLPEVHRSLGHRITRHEQYKLVRYDAGAGWFEAHRDNTAIGTSHRVLAVTINLDDVMSGDGSGEGSRGERLYVGGDLRFPELGADVWRPDPGDAIVFSCGLLHEVTPVTSGTRHALVTFLS